MWQPGPALAVSRSVNQRNFFVTPCRIHLSPRKEPHPFIWTNQFLLLFSDISARWRFASPSSLSAPVSKAQYVLLLSRKQWDDIKLSKLQLNTAFLYRHTSLLYKALAIIVVQVEKKTSQPKKWYLTWLDWEYGQRAVPWRHSLAYGAQ